MNYEALVKDLREHGAKVTPGPWVRRDVNTEHASVDVFAPDYARTGVSICHQDPPRGFGSGSSNMDFIAAARHLVPQAADAIEALLAALREVRRLADEPTTDREYRFAVCRIFVVAETALKGAGE